MKKIIKIIISLLICSVILSGFTCLIAGAAASNEYHNNPHWQETTQAAVNQMYNNGDKFIVMFGRKTCSNCQYIGTYVVTLWMDNYSYTVYGVDVDSEKIPDWGWNAAGSGQIDLPLVCFVNNKKVTAYYGAQQSAIDGMNSTFYSFTGYSPITNYTLTYNDNGGCCGPANQTGNGSITLSRIIPERDGYSFLGWATNSSASAAQYQPGASFKLTRDTTLYAVWKADPVAPVTTYTLTYDYNGGCCGPANQTGNGYITLSGLMPQKDNYTFLGWSTSANAAYALYRPGDSFNLTGNTTLYAVWEKASADINEPEHKLILTQKSYTVAVGDNASISYDIDGDSLYYVRLYTPNPEIVEVSSGKDDNSFTIRGINEGSVTLTITMEDVYTGELYDSQYIDVTVTESSSVGIFGMLLKILIIFFRIFAMI